jgi:hypothetical protein
VGGGRSVWMGRGCSRGIACLLVGRASAAVFFFFSTAVWIPRFVFSLMLYLDKCIDKFPRRTAAIISKLTACNIYHINKMEDILNDSKGGRYSIWVQCSLFSHYQSHTLEIPPNSITMMTRNSLQTDILHHTSCLLPVIKSTPCIPKTVAVE